MSLFERLKMDMEQYKKSGNKFGEDLIDEIILTTPKHRCPVGHVDEDLLVTINRMISSAKDVLLILESQPDFDMHLHNDVPAYMEIDILKQYLPEDVNDG